MATELQQALNLALLVFRRAASDITLMPVGFILLELSPIGPPHRGAPLDIPLTACKEHFAP